MGMSDKVDCKLGEHCQRSLFEAWDLNDDGICQGCEAVEHDNPYKNAVEQFVNNLIMDRGAPQRGYIDEMLELCGINSRRFWEDDTE